MESTHGKESVIFTRNLWLSLFTVLKDPESNVIFQWKNVTTFRNITQLAFHLTPEPMFGDYTIAVRKLSGMTVVHQFTVNRDGKQVLVLILLPLSSRTKLSRPGRGGVGGEQLEPGWASALLSAFLWPPQSSLCLAPGPGLPLILAHPSPHRKNTSFFWDSDALLKQI